ncbi:MAG: metallophosphoesterase [Euryarchaeota archaeon]|nr:metallophosphoesterase [Euryarchaeota archaeon]
MIIYAAADIHGAQYRLNLILDQIQAHKPDIVVICGDITQFGPGETAKNFLNQIPIKTFAVPGNIDSIDVGDAITESKAQNIDRRCIIEHDLPFIGVGGDLPLSLASLQIDDAGFMKSLDLVLDQKSILITHVPPFRTMDRVFIGHHIGNKELRTLIDSHRPRLVLCGHVHEDPGFTVVGSTTVVNCSLGKRTQGALIDVNDMISVQILD